MATALHIAAIWDACDAGRALLEAGADVNAQNDLGGATLLPAALLGRCPFRSRFLTAADSTLAEDSGRLAVDMCGPAHNQLREFLQDDLGSARSGARSTDLACSLISRVAGCFLFVAHAGLPPHRSRQASRPPTPRCRCRARSAHPSRIGAPRELRRQ